MLQLLADVVVCSACAVLVALMWLLDVDVVLAVVACCSCLL